jgi:hypothetical protein
MRSRAETWPTRPPGLCIQLNSATACSSAECQDGLSLVSSCEPVRTGWKSVRGSGPKLVDAVCEPVRTGSPLSGRLKKKVLKARGRWFDDKLAMGLVLVFARS